MNPRLTANMFMATARRFDKTRGTTPENLGPPRRLAGMDQPGRRVPMNIVIDVDHAGHHRQKKILDPGQTPGRSLKLVA